MRLIIEGTKEEIAKILKELQKTDLETAKGEPFEIYKEPPDSTNGQG